MNRARLKPWIVWLLPLFVLRAFVPVGFMVSSDSGSMQLTFCSSIAAPSADPHAMHHHHGADAASSHQHGSEAHERSLCPYVLTATANVHAVDYVPVVAPLRDERVAYVIAPPPQLVRSQSEPIRGPPVLG
jgi:hypothetical protein